MDNQKLMELECGSIAGNDLQSTVYRDLNLGIWVSTQREAFKNDKLSEEKVRLLSSLRGWV